MSKVKIKTVIETIIDIKKNCELFGKIDLLSICDLPNFSIDKYQSGQDVED